MTEAVATVGSSFSSVAESELRSSQAYSYCSYCAPLKAMCEIDLLRSFIAAAQSCLATAHLMCR